MNGEKQRKKLLKEEKNVIEDMTVTVVTVRTSMEIDINRIRKLKYNNIKEKYELKKMNKQLYVYMKEYIQNKWEINMELYFPAILEFRSRWSSD